MLDTRREAQQVLDDVVRGQSPAERLAAALQFSEDARSIALSGLRQRHPNESLLQLVERLSAEPMRPRMRMGPQRVDDR